MNDQYHHCPSWLDVAGCNKLREKCPYWGFFWSACECGHFSCSDSGTGSESSTFFSRIIIAVLPKFRAVEISNIYSASKNTIFLTK